MDKKHAIITAVLLAIMGLAAGLLLIRRPLTIVVDGQPRQVETTALTARVVLQEAGIPITQADLVSPPMDQWLGSARQIQLTTAKAVFIWMDKGILSQALYTTERTPEKMLNQQGITLAAGDRVLVNGSPVQPAQVLAEQTVYVLQVQRTQRVTLSEGGAERQISSATGSLGAALWQAGVQVTPGDAISPDYLALLGDVTKPVVLSRARAIKIAADGKEITFRTAARTVGQALAEAGIPLQGLDFSIPAEDKALPDGGAVQIVRVREEVELKQTFIPFKSELVADPELELDQRRIIQPGQEGIKVTRVLVRYENGKEVKRTTEAEWTAAEPQVQKTGYGTKIVIRTLDTPDGPIQYWRSARVYATSYAPCNFMLTIGRCSYTTANGSRLQKGIIGTGEAWYRIMVNQGVYVEGYGKGVVADWGYVGGYWVDLGFSDADFVNWHRYTTLYWLTPVPANVPWVLPP